MWDSESFTERIQGFFIFGGEEYKQEEKLGQISSESLSEIANGKQMFLCFGSLLPGKILTSSISMVQLESFRLLLLGCHNYFSLLSKGHHA